VRTIAVANLKGGVGKTTTAVYLSYLLAARKPTVLVDTDPQGSALAWSEAARTFPFRVVAPPAPYLRDLARRLPEVTGGGANVVIDTPPGHPEIVRSAALAAAVVLIPVSPFAMDLDRLTATIDLLATLPRADSPEVRVLLTNTRLGTNSLAAARAALQALGMPVLRVGVPRRESIGNSFGTAPADLFLYNAVLDELVGERAA
jgi:chromosome partitioning protein